MVHYYCLQELFQYPTKIGFRGDNRYDVPAQILTQTGAVVANVSGDNNDCFFDGCLQALGCQQPQHPILEGKGMHALGKVIHAHQLCNAWACLRMACVRQCKFIRNYLHEFAM